MPEPPRPAINQPPETITVTKVVAVECIKASDIPAPPVPVAIDVDKASIAQRAAAVSLNARNQAEYADKLRAALLACTR